MLNSEREKLVVDLYNQGKNVREIAQEARMSFRDIGAILKKAKDANNGNAIDDGKDNNNNKHTKATQAYKLFSEGKKLVEVSIELGLRETEASKLFSEFLRLKGQDEIYEIYLENKHYLRTLRTLLRVLKREGMAAAIDKIDWFVNMIKIGAYKIPELQNEYQKIKNELEVIDHKNISQLSTTYIKKRNEIACLQFGIQELEGYIHGLNNQQQEEIENETYI